MSDLRIQANIDNGDLPEQLTLFPLSYKDEINRKEQNDKFIFKTNIKF